MHANRLNLNEWRADPVGFSLKKIFLFCSLLTVVTTFTVVGLLGTESFAFFSEVGVFEFLFGSRWEPLLEPKSFGVLPLVAGTTLIVLGAMIVAVPVGLFIAIYLSEYASPVNRKVIKPALEILAGIPTVVYGYFALTFVTPILRIIFPETQIFNAASGAIVVGIMIIPMISSLCDDAFRALGDSLRLGAYGLGMHSFEVIFFILIPAAASRIGAAVILALSRALGETMAVTLAAGATPNMTFNPLKSIQTMTAYIVQVSLGDTPAGGVEYLTCFAVAALLFLMTFSLNFIGASAILKRKG